MLYMIKLMYHISTFYSYSHFSGHYTRLAKFLFLLFMCFTNIAISNVNRNHYRYVSFFTFSLTTGNTSLFIIMCFRYIDILVLASVL
ncbi:hypothetical protein HanPSC8_Chr10g0411691 [Helianthus annuus]|nr:hypothetical protein HanPSC8_Chr10g0411691 [Helianthus annuus]